MFPGKARVQVQVICLSIILLCFYLPNSVEQNETENATDISANGTTATTTCETTTVVTQANTTTVPTNQASYCVACYNESTKLGITFGANSLTYCMSPENQLYYCSDDSQMYEHASAGAAPAIPCYGNFNFSFQSIQYWLNGGLIYRINSDATLSDVTSDFTNYLADLRPNEGFLAALSLGPSFAHIFHSPEIGTGSFYGSITRLATPSSSSELYAYFYNGTYYDLMVDGNGTLYSKPQNFSQYTVYFLDSFTFQDKNGCNSPICCLVRDNNVTRLADGAIEAVDPVDYMYSSTTKWVVSKGGGEYQLYTGEVLGIGMASCLWYFGDLTWRLDDGTKYGIVNGSIYRIDPSTGLPVEYITFDTSMFHSMDTDPLAKGGYYYYYWNNGLLREAYKNLSGIYFVNIKDGVLHYQRPPPDCSTRTPRQLVQQYPPPCAQTTDVYTVTANIICDPLVDAPGICGAGYRCIPAAPTSLVGSSCSKGFCRPDYSNTCPATTTAVTNTSDHIVLQRYGSGCYYGSDCYTGICTDSICTCTNCTKILPALDIDIDSGSLIYLELCIPINSTIGGIGDTCQMWAQVKTTYCGFGLFCSKCPEVWNSVYAEATCVPVNIPQTSGDALVNDSSSCGCGYRATCKMVAGITTCTCSPGFNLDSNLIDCYGWNVTNEGSCSVTCGNGVRTITRVCDTAPFSSAVCVGNTTISEPCTVGEQCPLPAKLVSAAVLVEIQSKVITVKLFDTYIEKPVKAKLVAALNEKCVSDGQTFEDQCCVGRAWSAALSSVLTSYDCVDADTGVEFLNKFSDGKSFKFYITAVGNISSACCNAITVAGSRKKRAASAGNFDQSILLGIVNDPTVIAVVSSSSQAVDPNAAIQPISIATTTTTTTALALKLAGSSDDDALPIWAIAVIVVGVVVLLIIIIVAAVYATKSGKNDAKVAPETEMQGAYQQPVLRTPISPNKEQMRGVSSKPVSGALPPVMPNNGYYGVNYNPSPTHMYNAAAVDILNNARFSGHSNTGDDLTRPPRQQLPSSYDYSAYNAYNQSPQQNPPQQQPYGDLTGRTASDVHVEASMPGPPPSAPAYPAYYGIYPPPGNDAIAPRGAHGY